MSITIYSSELSPFGARLRLAVALKKLDVEFLPPLGGTGSAEFKNLTPFGRVPALVDNGQVLVESLALLEYLEDTQPGARSLRPADAVGRARVRMIGLLFDHQVVKAMQGIFAQLMSPTPNTAAASAAFDAAEIELAKLAQLADPAGPLVGGQWTIADCAVVPFAFLLDVLAQKFAVTSPMQRVPRLASWWAQARELPEVDAVTARAQVAFDAMMAAKKPAT